MKQIAREHRFTWSDPNEVVSKIVGRPQLEWMADMIAGTIPPPPYPQALGLKFEEAEPGFVRFSTITREWMANPLGVLHGGFCASLLDSVMTLAVVTKIPADRTATTLDFTIRFTRPVVPDGQTLSAEGHAVHVGATVGTAEGKVLDAQGRIVAHGSATMAVLVPR
jgi:acyl-CoA thioesterase